MDDISEKLQSMLSDEEGLKKLQSIYEILSESGCKEESTDQSENCECEDTNQAGEFDFSNLLKMQSLFNADMDNNSTALINALKPYLSPEKQKKADKAVKLLNILNMYTVLKETGLLNDFL